MPLPGLRGFAVGALLLGAAAVSAQAAGAIAEPPPLEASADEAPADEAPARDPAAVPVPPDALGPAEVAKEIAAACIEKRYSDVGALLHPSLRRVWIDIGYNVKQFCELLTRNDTLLKVRVDKEERQGNYAVIYLTYTYQDGSEHADRSTFLPFKGIWKLAG